MLPLKGKKVLVTREESQAKKFTSLLDGEGAVVVEVPLLKVTCRNSIENKDIFHHLDQYEWFFFTSINGVECFFTLLDQYGACMPKVKIAVVGHKTEEALKRYGYQAKFIPSIYDGETLVKEFVTNYSDIGKSLLIQGNRSRDVVEIGLTKARIPFDTVTVYETTYNEEAKEKLPQVLVEEFDFITFTSPSTVEAFITFYQEALSKQTKIICIGSTTERRARELGFTHTYSPDMYTIEGMLDVMCKISLERDDPNGK